MASLPSFAPISLLTIWPYSFSIHIWLQHGCTSYLLCRTRARPRFSTYLNPVAWSFFGEFGWALSPHTSALHNIHTKYLVTHHILPPHYQIRYFQPTLTSCTFQLFLTYSFTSHLTPSPFTCTTIHHALLHILNPSLFLPPHALFLTKPGGLKYCLKY